MQIRPAVDTGGMDTHRRPVQPQPLRVNRGMANRPHPVQRRLRLAYGGMAEPHDGSRAGRGRSG